MHPFPPGLPPLFGDPIRVYSPLAFEVPEADDEGLFSIKCAVEHCGDGLPIFKSSSRMGIVSKVSEMAESGSLFRSACAYECARTVSSHALSLDDFTQLFTTSTLPSAFFSYPRLSHLQESVLSESQTDGDDGDGNLGASAEGASTGTFSPLERIAVERDLTMQECGEFFEARKNIAMHAVWLYNDDTTEIAVGDCSLFLAARSTFQHTLWDSFFEHARRVTTIGHFETAVPSRDHVAFARPPSGEDCDFDHRTAGGAASAATNTDTTWRACVWWSEFQSDVQDELACSPDRVRYILNPFSTPICLAFPKSLNPLPFPCLAGRLQHHHPEQDARRPARGADRVPAAVAATPAAAADRRLAAASGRKLPVRLGLAPAHVAPVLCAAVLGVVGGDRRHDVGPRLRDRPVLTRQPVLAAVRRARRRLRAGRGRVPDQSAADAAIAPSAAAAVVPAAAFAGAGAPAAATPAAARVLEEGRRKHSVCHFLRLEEELGQFRQCVRSLERVHAAGQERRAPKIPLAPRPPCHLLGQQ